MTKKFEIIKTKDSSRRERHLIFGRYGTGKSTLAASVNDGKALFVCTENGLDEIDAESFPVCKNFNEVMDQLKYIYSGDLEHTTICIDTIGGIEQLSNKQVMVDYNLKSMSSLGYGEAYSLSLENMRKFINALGMINSKLNKRIILLGHSVIRTANDPGMPAYDVNTLACREKVNELMAAWADMISFLDTKKYISNEEGKFGASRVIASDGSTRILKCYKNSTSECKNRYGIVDDIEIPIVNGYQAIIDAIKAGRESLNNIKNEDPNKNDK